MTQVPLARHTTTGGSSTSAAESFELGRRADHLARLKRIFRLVFPTSVMTPSASMKSPA